MLLQTTLRSAQTRWAWQRVLFQDYGDGLHLCNASRIPPTLGVTEMCLHFEEADLTSRGNPRCWARSQERLDLLREQELLAGLGIQPQRKKSTDMELLWSFTDRLKGP